jgi:peptidyl-prolyl cis-trans isomerase SurA
MRGAAALALVLLGLASASPGRPLAAQQAPAVIDRIAAVVGERIILLSEIDEEINQRRGSGLQPPEDSAGLEALRHQVLSDLIDDEVLFQRARRDTTISVTDQEVQSAVDDQYRRVREQFRAEPDFRSALQGAGLGTPEEYRRWLSDRQRRAAYQQRYIGKLQQEGKLRPGTVSEAELRRAYGEAMVQGQRKRPATVSFRRIVIAPVPTEAAQRAALQRAESVRVAIAGGADLAELARRFSDDASTRENGGDLGFFRRGQMVRQFEEVAFSLRPGVVSPVVVTPYGYHLILVERVQPAEVKARHILFAPAVGAAELDAARQLADSLAALVRAGASADSLARLHGDTTEPRSLGPLERAQLDTAYAEAFGDAQAGQVVGPFALNPETPSRMRFVVAQLTDVQPERDYSFEEVRDQLRAGLLRERGVRNLLDDLRRQTYVDVRL